MIRFLLPLGLLLALLALLGYGLTQDPRELPSVLIDRPAPQFELPRVADANQRLTTADLSREPVVLFNVWASWCVACRQEHPLLMQLSRETDVPIFGLNYKDERGNAQAWLARFGNPYRASAHDLAGKVGIDFGVYGVPETFVVDGRGIIRYKHVGPITRRDWDDTLQPIVQRLRGDQP